MDMISLRRNLMSSAVPNLVEYTTTGNPVAFTTQLAKPVKSVTVSLSCTQEGTGDPSPSNIRPISGVSSLFCAHAKKNMATLRGYSAENKNYDIAGSLSNNYGTTISTLSPESSLVITQSSSTTDYQKNNYRNGYMIFRTDNMVIGQRYDVSIKVTNITSNPLETALSELGLTSPSGGITSPTEVIGNVVIWKNMEYKDLFGRQAWEFRNCGMSCTVSEFMVTPANTNDGVYESYNGEKLDVVFPALGKNLCPPPVKGIGVQGYNGTEFTDENRATTDYIPIDFIANPSYMFSGMPNTLTMWASGYNANKEFVGRTSSDKRSTYTITSERFNQGTPTHTGDVAFVRLTFNAGSGASIDDVDSASIQLEVGDTATAYEPYCNTVYGGSLDLVSGVLNVMYGSHTFNGDETFEYLETRTSLGIERHIFNTNVLDNYAARNSGSRFCANIAVSTGSGGSSNPLCFYNGTPKNQFGFYIDSSLCEGSVNSFKTWLAEHPCQVAFPLATPFTIQLDPHSITAIKGTNTFWTDTTGDLTITYLDKA